MYVHLPQETFYSGVPDPFCTAAILFLLFVLLESPVCLFSITMYYSQAEQNLYVYGWVWDPSSNSAAAILYFLIVENPHVFLDYHAKP